MDNKLQPFDLDIWLQDKSREVVDTNGRPVEILAIPLDVHFWHLVPPGVDPATCVTYHARREGSRNAPVLTGGLSKQFFFKEDKQ